jgi:hypothetical protein
MNITTRSRALCAALSAAAAMTAWPIASLAAGGIKAAYVEEVIPSRTFFGRMLLAAPQRVSSTGPGTGVFGVTSLTFINNLSTPTSVSIYSPILSNQGCGSPPIGQDFATLMVFPLQGDATMHLTYPTPLVLGNVSCIGAVSPGNVNVYVNGVVN